MRTVLALLIVGAVAGASSPARAQTSPTPASAVPVTASGVPMVGPLLGPPQVTWLFAQGDANGGRGDTFRPSSILFEPIRLALLGEAFDAGTGLSGCNEIESAGNATAGSPGFAAQHATAVQLSPRLTLAGFSRGGCQLDAAAGGALVYAAPIRRDVWLVASAGILQLPHAGPNGTPVTKSHARIDLIFARPAGQSLHVGIGKRGLTFGGTL